jgi:hypothetical protein
MYARARDAVRKGKGSSIGNFQWKRNMEEVKVVELPPFHRVPASFHPVFIDAICDQRRSQMEFPVELSIAQSFCSAVARVGKAAAGAEWKFHYFYFLPSDAT